MTLRRLKPPGELAVSLEEAKLALRVDGDDQDALIEAWVSGITEHAEHYCQRSFINQTWRLMLDSFPVAVQLRYLPIVSVSSIKYLDAGGQLQTVNAADYLLDDAESGCVTPAPGKAWPAGATHVTVDYVAGYGADHEAVPSNIRLYIQAKLVEQFDPAVRVEKDTVQASYIDRLLDRSKVYS